MTVLVLARNFDPTADAAMAALAEHQVPVLRTDLAAFPRQLRRDARRSPGGGPAGWATNITRSPGEIRSIWDRSSCCLAGLPSGAAEDPLDRDLGAVEASTAEVHNALPAILECIREIS